MASPPTSLPPNDPRHRPPVVEQELVHSVRWLVSLRWLAGAVVLVAASLSAALRFPVPGRLLSATGIAILLYNAGFWLLLRRLRPAGPSGARVFETVARVQIALDWAAMTVLVSLSGGAESPAVVFFLFHITIASLVLPHRLGFLYVSMAPLLVGGVAALEYAGVLPHVAILQPARFHDPLYVAASVGFFAAACYVMAYCCMSIARRLRRRESELGGLYNGVQAINSSLEITAVLDGIVEAAARVLGCRAAAIRLIDLARSQVEFAAAWGLSEAYRDIVPEEYTRSRLDQDTLAAGVVHVRDVDTDGRVWQPERVRAEGIASMLSVVIAGRSGPLGVLRAYGAPGHRFSDEDAAYLQAVAAHGAAAIENAKAYRLLADLDRDKSRFLRMTTHELRAPVRVTESLLLTLSEGYAGPLGAEQTELVGRAKRRLATLHLLIDDLLALAAGKAHLVTLQQRTLDLRAVVAEVVERFQPVADEKHVTLTVCAPEAPLEVWCDPDDLDRIVGNLVSNAVKYTPRGSVTVTLSGEADHVSFTVADTGIGIPETAVPHLFQEFFRASNAKAVEESGTGLGLSITQLLVQRYGGRIAVASTEGQGTTFSVEMARAARAGTV